MIEVKSEAEFNRILSTVSPLIIDFYATWCGPCKVIGAEIDKIEKNGRYNHITFVKVNADKLSGILDRYRVAALPTILAIKGDKLWRIEGAKITELMNVLNNL